MYALEALEAAALAEQGLLATVTGYREGSGHQSARPYQPSLRLRVVEHRLHGLLSSATRRLRAVRRTTALARHARLDAPAVDGRQPEEPS